MLFCTFYRITSELKEIVYYSKQPIGLLFHALSQETIKKFIANALSLSLKSFVTPAILESDLKPIQWRTWVIIACLQVLFIIHLIRFPYNVPVPATLACTSMLHSWTKANDRTGNSIRVFLFGYHKTFHIIDYTIAKSASF